MSGPSRMSLWDRRKNDDYTFIDESIREMFDIGGVEVLLHKYIGVYDQGETLDSDTRQGILKIQDLFLLENRDRAYDPNVYQLRGVYNVQDTEFDIRQFGLFLEADTLYLEFHINDVLEKINRKLLSGDVLEFPHLRDDSLLDEGLPAVNKFYVVSDVNRAAGGWSAVWRPHIFRAKLKPLTDSQEYADILNPEWEDSGQSLRDILSDYNGMIGVSDAILEEAETNVMKRNFQTLQFYVVPGDETGKQFPWIFAGDGIPPNGAELAGQGTTFPAEPRDGDWFLHTGSDPHILYRFVSNINGGGVWERREVDLRKKWEAAHRILQSFINNDNQSSIQGEVVPERQMLSRVIKPRADF